MNEEALELVLASWGEPRPFGWEGRFYRYRTVAVWPRPVQLPRPPLLLAGTSTDSAKFAAQKRAMLGLSFLNSPDEAAGLAATYRAEAARTGWEPTREDILFRARIYVAETDELAESEAREYDLGNVLGPLVPRSKKQAANRKILEAVFGPSGFRHHPPGPGAMPEYFGSPETVARQLREAGETIGYGVADLIFAGDKLPHDKAMSSLELFSTHVLPAIRDAVSTVTGPRRSSRTRSALVRVSASKYCEISR